MFARARFYPAPIDYPLIHPAGRLARRQGLERIADPDALAEYDRRHRDADGFTVSPFVDYRSADGQWRKYLHRLRGWRALSTASRHPSRLGGLVLQCRDGARPAEVPGREPFPALARCDLPTPARNALRALADRVGLDYFGVDCG